jgi:iron-sulfur cluster insertion protein
MSESENIVVSDSALKQIAHLIQIEGNPNLMLRVYITGGGCAGFQYGFAFDKQPREDDYISVNNVDLADDTISVKVAIDPMSLMYLHGAVVDYVENLKGRHFTVKNPNASTTCSCGSSFGIGDD